jgi:hypothetical protein
MIERSRSTRRDALRTLAAGGVVAASATMPGGCGGVYAPPAPLPPATSTGRPIMIIRHGEKPADSGSPQGIDPDGNLDPHSLIVRGWPRPGPARPGLARPTAIYASGGTGGEGQRPRQTVTPLAARLGLTVNTHYAKGDETTLANEVAARTGPTLICWQHGELPGIVSALGSVTPVLPTAWPDNRFNLIWVLTRASTGW